MPRSLLAAQALQLAQ